MLSYNMKLQLKVELLKKDIQLKDLQMQLEMAKMHIESAEVLAAEERSRQSSVAQTRAPTQFVSSQSVTTLNPCLQFGLHERVKH